MRHHISGFPVVSIEDVARICHEANRGYCSAIGDNSQFPWDEAPQWQRDSAINGVRFHLANPTAGPAGSHENWMREKLAARWVYGPIKNPGGNPPTHPCLVPFIELPVQQQAKDFIFEAIVRAMAPGITER